MAATAPKMGVTSPKLVFLERKFDFVAPVRFEMLKVELLFSSECDRIVSENWTGAGSQ